MTDTRKDLLAIVEHKLLDYCKNVDAVLNDAANEILHREQKSSSITPADDKAKLVAKFFTVEPVSRDPEFYDQGSRHRKLFLNEATFHAFFQELIASLENLTAKDIETLHTEKETVAATAFRQCVDKLHQAGFYNASGKLINFWSGPQAQEAANAYKNKEQEIAAITDPEIWDATNLVRDRANSIENSLSDSNVPATSVMSMLGVLLKEQSKTQTDEFRTLSDKTFSSSSAEFALQTTGVVTVYSSMSNVREELLATARYLNPKKKNFSNAELEELKKKIQTGEIPEDKIARIINKDNFHWSVELPIIQRLIGQGVVAKINFVGYSHILGKFLAPVDFNKALNMYVANRRKSISGPGITQEEKNQDTLIWQQNENESRHLVELQTLRDVKERLEGRLRQKQTKEQIAQNAIKRWKQAVKNKKSSTATSGMFSEQKTDEPAKAKEKEAAPESTKKPSCCTLL